MPFGVEKVALLGTAGSAGAKTYWALAFHPNTDGDESTGLGLAVDSSDNVYWGFYDASGYEGYLVKFEQADGLPTTDVQTKLDNYVPVSGLTVWDNSGTETLACYGSRNATSESCWIYNIETDLTTSINSGRSGGIYINSGDNAGQGSNQAELDTSNGKLFWSSQDDFNYYGWKTIQGGVWFKNGYQITQTTYPTYTGGSGLSGNHGQNWGCTAFQWGADRWGVATRRQDTPHIVGNHTTSGQTAVGTAYEYAASTSNIQSCESAATWNPGETGDDYAYWLITNPIASPNPTVSLIKLNEAGTVSWNRTLTGDGMYTPGTTGTAGTSMGKLCKPIFDSSDNCYIAWGDLNGAGGLGRTSIAKYDSSGVIQWQNAIEVSASSNWFAPQQLALSDDEEDLYVSMNRASFNGVTGIILKVPSDGSLTSGSSIALDGGTFTYDATSYTEAAGSWTVSTVTTMGWATSTSQSAAGTGTWGVGSTFTPYLHTAEVA